jgi:hypothetical protein
MSGYGMPRITGDWARVDGSANTIEVAPTEKTQEHGLIALRSSNNPETVIPVTINQLKKLPAAFDNGGSLYGLINF